VSFNFFNPTSTAFASTSFFSKKVQPVYSGGNTLPEEPSLAEDDEVLDKEKDFEPKNVDNPKTPADYEAIYRQLEPADFSYHHDIDPDQYYDMQHTTWSPYPLLRLTSPIYFKNITIEPGYYLLTPREHNGDWYVLFKSQGLVVHIIPVFEKDFTPETFYEKHIPKRKMTFAQSFHVKFLHVLGITDKASKRQPPKETYLELTDLDNHYLILTLYYGKAKYSLIFRTVSL